MTLPINTDIAFTDISDFNNNESINEGELSVLHPPLQLKSSIIDNNKNAKMANVANVCLNTQHIVKKFKTRLNYKIYNLMLPTLLLFLILFCILIWNKGNNSVKMLEIDEKKSIASAELNKVYDALQNSIDASGNSSDILYKEFDKKQKELNEIKSNYNSSIHIDNYCDKLTDLCNGIIGAILMVYIGSAGYKMIRLNERGDKNIPTCPIPNKSLLERVLHTKN